MDEENRLPLSAPPVNRCVLSRGVSTIPAETPSSRVLLAMRALSFVHASDDKARFLDDSHERRALTRKLRGKPGTSRVSIGLGQRPKFAPSWPGCVTSASKP